MVGGAWGAGATGEARLEPGVEDVEPGQEHDGGAETQLAPGLGRHRED